MMRFSMLSLVTVLSMNCAQAEEGTVGGGGGSSVKVPAITAWELREIMQKSRGELYLFFLRQSREPATPEIQRLFSGNKSIIDIIQSTAISIAPYGGCRDAAGNVVDGSIIAKPGTICIGIRNAQLDRDSARNQVLSLVAHEYSHLLGFDENDATKLQKQVYNLVGVRSKESVFRMYREASFLLGALRGVVIHHFQTTGLKDWNYLCYTSDRALNYFGSLYTNDLIEQYSFFGVTDSLKFRTYMMMTMALNYKSCGESNFYPNRADYLYAYNLYFGKDDVIPADKFSQHFSDTPVDSSVQFHRLKSPTDFDLDFNEIAYYIEKTNLKMNTFEKLYDAKLDY